MANRVVELKEEIYKYVSTYGPVLPVPVAKHFRGTTIFISALLSELVSSKRVLMSRAKVGGSPLYYCSHQKEKLYNSLSNNVGKKQKEALDLLAEKKVVRDRDLLPFERVALRELVDFAKPIRFTINETEELFWKWFMHPDSETKTEIESILHSIYTPEEKEIVPQELIPEVVHEAIQETKKIGSEFVTIDNPQGTQVFANPVLIASKSEKHNSGNAIFDLESIEEIPAEKKKIKKKVSKKKSLTTKPSEQKVLSEVVETSSTDDFLSKVHAHLRSLKITILKSQLLTKNREGNLTVQVPSQVGDLKYFVKARNRKKLSEGDLLLAYTEAQNFKLPLLLVSNASLSKKAEKYMEKNLPGMQYIKLDN